MTVPSRLEALAKGKPLPTTTPNSQLNLHSGVGSYNGLNFQLSDTELQEVQRLIVKTLVADAKKFADELEAKLMGDLTPPTEGVAG